MTDVRTFRADNMQAALDLVREEMGGEAVILHTRQTTKRRILPWRKPAETVEITAGLGVDVQHRATKTTVGDGVAAASTVGVRPQSITPAKVSGDGVSLDFSRASREIDPPLNDHFDSRAGGAVTRALQPESNPDPTVQFAEKLESIQKMLNELGRSSTLRKADEIPGELFSLYTELIDADVEDDVARNLIGQLKEHASPKQLNDVKAGRNLLTALVESEIRCSDPIMPTPGKQKVVALVGTTGVGKTTTIAKLAANFRLRDGIKMGLVTVDTYRIAAVEQLRTYAEIIDLPMKVVTSPPEMRRALDELAGLDLILIDTAGRSPRDELQIQELKSLLAEANVDEVHLVLSLTSSVRSLLATAEQFGVANATSLILTKLDEAAGLGSLLSLVQRVDLPISYVTTGQDVPDDIEPARASRLARLVLGQDSLFD
ncbi:MAG: flagellar biosynthesis protein FlhF [Planctomycetaceae bacterium]|jgi:flagellar biosynthesis protein FlhF|nr:flagellar biosynthesis protein FlhF [Planctomycetaceae bacterium]MBT6157914.1 flagellar biosynthesis protein FlhF [Planctomycetaceae bacterium]MBT6487440.1 flagellar biosynthesis protein FlhF [Planctomycetaceae bacterium]MBT6495585.1 flagellar biosynthesis protein FlhF [Planctomycetaceae bacterium]